MTNYTTQEIADLCGITKSSLRDRASVLKLNPMYDHNRNFLWSDYHKKQLLNYHQIRKEQREFVKEVKKVNIVNETCFEVVYVVRESHFYESKSNHYTPEKINEIIAEFGEKIVN